VLAKRREMANNNRAYVDDSGRILRNNQPEHPPIVEWEDDPDEDEPEFSTYFADQKVEIPTFPDDEKVSLQFTQLIKPHSNLIELLFVISK
jgi:hypothetical protein